MITGAGIQTALAADGFRKQTFGRGREQLEKLHSTPQ
jgi:hypothetical protein